jgi:nicotinamidase-related amidase
VPVDVDALIDPKHAALLVMECQEGVIGAATAGFNALAEAVHKHDMIGAVAKLIAAARGAGVPIFYLNASRRADSAGSTANCLLLALGRKGEPLVPGSARHHVVDALAPQPADFVVNRFHGVTPFHGTELDSLLRNLGVRTVVATGVSVNVGITGLTLEAVNCGYQVVLPRDAVAGTPDDYVEAVFQNTLRLLATVSRSDDIVAAWNAKPKG